MKKEHEQRSIPFTPHCLALAAAALGLAGAAQAQTAAPAAAAPAAQLDTIVVTGIRASKDLSLRVKRAADGVTEVVSAEDIGKMPDKNVADALQKLPGIVTMAGSGGQGGYDENDRVSMRGTSASMTLTTINGHSVATADWDPGDQIAGGAGSNTSGAARSVSFLLLPSEIVSQVIVHKSASADLLEGGLAGNIDIVTRRPLEFKKPFTAELGLQGVYSQQANTTDPQFAALFNWRNQERDTGLMLQVFDQTRHIRRDGQEGIGWSQISAGTPAGKANGGQYAGLYYVNGVIDSLFQQERHRSGAVVDAQFKPTQTLTLNLDGFYSKLDASYSNTRLYVRPANSVAASGGVVPGNVVSSGNLITSASFANTGNATGAQIETQDNPNSSSNTGYLNADFKWQASENLQFNGLLGSTKAEGNSDLYWNYQFLANTPTAYTYNGPERPMSISFPGGINPANLSALPGNSAADNSYSVQHTLDQEQYAQIDGEYQFGDGLFNSIKFGLRHADHDRQGTRPVKAGPPENAAQNGQVTLTTTPAYTGATFPGNFGGNLGAGAQTVAGLAPVISPASVLAWSNANLSAATPFNLPVSGVFEVKERSDAAYAMSKLSGQDWRGDFGLRLVSTHTSVTTNTPLSCGVPSAGNGITFGSAAQTTACAPYVPTGATLVTGSRFGNFYRSTTDSTDTELLPSANLTFDASRDLVLRAGVAKVMSRPDYSALGSTISGFAYTVGATPASTASGGNPTLQPNLAYSYNLGAEWYFKPRALLSAQLFYLNFGSLIGAGTSTQNLFNTAVPASMGGPQVVSTVVSSPVSTSGRSQGIELGYEQPLWSNFGVQANYTYADAREANGNPMLGAARNAYTLGGFYEDEAFSARLSYSYRGDSRVGLYGLSQNYLAAGGTLSASANYKVSDALTLTMEALNLNSPVQRYFNAPNAAVPFTATTAMYSSGRQLYLGLRYKY